MGFRTDKENANYVGVAENIKDSISFLRWAVGIKAGWRARNPKTQIRNSGLILINTVTINGNKSLI
jgi:hypothetical protein